jgi:electron transport complex protein RnfD
VSGQTPIGGPHTHAQASVGRTMVMVLAALVPATAFGIYHFGWPALNLFILTVAAAVASEALCLRLARKPLGPFLFDGSAVLTGWLLAMTLPPWAPWWIGVFGGAFAIVIGKQVFGGIGQNVFNPAMLARVALLVSFPLEMTTWIDAQPLWSHGSPDILQGLGITFSGIPNIDSVSSASLMGHARTELTQGHGLTEALAGHFAPTQSFLGLTNGSLGETSALALLAGGLFLLAARIITWHIPAALVGTIALLATGFHTFDPERYAEASFHLLNGATMLGAFFIATDYVTSPSTGRGQLVFGAGCGLLVYAIRTWGGFPEGMGFAVLLMNALTPVIDHYLRPRIYGRTIAGSPVEYSPDATLKKGENG